MVVVNYFSTPMKKNTYGVGSLGFWSSYERKSFQRAEHNAIHV